MSCNQDRRGGRRRYKWAHHHGVRVRQFRGDVTFNPNTKALVLQDIEAGERLFATLAATDALHNRAPTLRAGTCKMASEILLAHIPMMSRRRVERQRIHQEGV